MLFDRSVFHIQEILLISFYILVILLPVESK